jgi:hypothetical protein
MNLSATIELLLEMGASTWSVPRSFINKNWGDKVSPSREFVKRGLELVKLKNLHC